MSKSIMLFACLLAIWPAHAADPRPSPQRALPTTDGAIYLGNLDQRISVLDALHRRAADAANAAALAGLFYHRYRIRGALADAERAFALADSALMATHPDPEHFVLRATFHSGFHRFAEAASDLDAAQALGMSQDALLGARRELALARGGYAESEKMSASSGVRISDFDRFAFDAHLRELHNDAAGASLLYAKAESAYDDTNPVPLAWLYVQQGAALLEAGDAARARPFFAAAQARLPGYTLATEHLAETEALLGDTRRARALYREAIAASDDPAFIDALAALELKAGNDSLAAQLERQARDGWERRIAKYPAAFSGHAIEYFLDHGEPQRALALARDNIRNRRDIGSLALLAQAAAAAGEMGQACTTWREADASGLTTPAFRDLSALGQRCRQQSPY